MLKLVLIVGLGITALALVLGLCVVLVEHFQHRNKQEKYADLHRRMGLEDHDSSGVDMLDD